jgi:5'-nucleotidase
MHKRDFAILITNDDGFGVEGLTLTQEALEGIAPVLVVVPKANNSGISHKITLHESLAVEKQCLYSLHGTDVFVVDGTPADCVRLGIFSLSKIPVGLVVAGINHGANMGEDVVYSGTVAAAREGAILGIKSFAVSMIDDTMQQDSAIKEIIHNFALWLIRHKIPNNSFFNINFPQHIAYRRHCVQITTLGKRIYGTEYMPTRISSKSTSYKLKEHVSGHHIKGTDIYATHHGRVSVTPLTLDFTDNVLHKKLKVLPRALCGKLL